MLQYLIPVMKNATTAILPLAMMMAIIWKRQSGLLLNRAWRGVLLGSGGAFAVAVLRYNSLFIKRETYEGWVLGFALVSEALMLFFFWRAYKKGDLREGDIPEWTVFVVASALFLYSGLDFFLFAAKFLTPASTLPWTELAFQVAGLFLGLGLAVLVGLAVFRVVRSLHDGRSLAVITAGFFVSMLQQAIVELQILLGKGLVPMSKGLLAMMVLLINHLDWFFCAVLVVTFCAPVLLFLQRKPDHEKGLNPAQYRKILAVARRQLRWGAASAVSLFLAFFLVTVGQAYADKKMELSPAVKVTVQQGQINIPVTTVEDGSLHRFAYTASNGTVVRFIIIKKSGSAYGVGLDACEICGPTGYFEREGQVVCKLCDVMMNKATIGFKGGCNPVPLEFKMAAGKIVIPAEALEKEKKRFR